MERITMEDSHKIVYDKIIKRHKSSNQLHINQLIFYLLDISLLIGNIVIHTLNQAYTGLILTITIHLISAFIVSIVYDHNEKQIDDDNKIFQGNKNKWNCLRKISKCLAITPLFRIIVNWKDHAENHKDIRAQQKMRNEIACEEVEKAVLIRKRLLVNAYFDSIHVFCKTIPQCLLQIFIALDLNLPLRFCGLTDVTRFVTMFVSVLVTARACAAYTSEMADYLKLLEIQDQLEYERIGININLPVTHLWWSSFGVNAVVIGTRLYSISYIMRLTDVVIIPITMVIVLFILTMIWIRINTESRLIYENPPRGILTVHSELLDRFMNTFSVHTIKLSFTSVFYHQVIFIMTYIIFLTGTLALATSGSRVSVQGQWTNNSVIVTAEDSLRCNFSIYSNSKNKVSKILHQVFNEYSHSVPMFAELFTQNTVILLTLTSGITCGFYILYLKFFELHTHKFPVQVGFKAWTILLNKDWNEVGKIGAVQILLLGVLNTTSLELMNYKLPNDLGLLKGIMENMIQNGLLVPSNDTLPCTSFPSPCDNELRKLRNYLADIDLTEPICDHWIKYFHLYMDRMNSHRIAQTLYIIKDQSLFRRLWFSNIKYFGLLL